MFVVIIPKNKSHQIHPKLIIIDFDTYLHEHKMIYKSFNTYFMTYFVQNQQIPELYALFCLSFFIY